MTAQLDQQQQEKRTAEQPLLGAENVPKAPAVPKADMLRRINLLPVMGRRDAAFDLAERLSCQEDFSAFPSIERGEAYRQIAELLRTVYEDCRQISMMLTSPDTKTREYRLFLHAVMLKSFAAALADFFRRWEVVERDHEKVRRFSVNELGEGESAPLTAVMADVENGLLHQLRDCFRRARRGVARYRAYAVKSFSAENGRRYRSSYSIYHARKEALAKKFLSISHAANESNKKVKI